LLVFRSALIDPAQIAPAGRASCSIRDFRHTFQYILVRRDMSIPWMA